MIDKPIQLEDMSLSEKEIVQDKDNSVLNKSFFNEDFNFQDLVEKKNFFQIKIESQDYHLHCMFQRIYPFYVIDLRIQYYQALGTSLAHLRKRPLLQAIYLLILYNYIY